MTNTNTSDNKQQQQQRSKSCVKYFSSVADRTTNPPSSIPFQFLHPQKNKYKRDSSFSPDGPYFFSRKNWFLFFLELVDIALNSNSSEMTSQVFINPNIWHLRLQLSTFPALLVTICKETWVLVALWSCGEVDRPISIDSWTRSSSDESIDAYLKYCSC